MVRRAARPLWLAPFSWLYGAVMGLRSLLYRMGLRHRVEGRRARGGGGQSHGRRHRQDAAGRVAVDAGSRPPGCAWPSCRAATAAGPAASRASRCTAARARWATSRCCWRGARRPRYSSGATGSPRPRPRLPMGPTSCSAMMDCNTWRWCGSVKSWSSTVSAASAMAACCRAVRCARARGGCGA